MDSPTPDNRTSTTTGQTIGATGQNSVAMGVSPPQPTPSLSLSYARPMGVEPASAHRHQFLAGVFYSISQAALLGSFVACFTFTYTAPFLALVGLISSRQAQYQHLLVRRAREPSYDAAFFVNLLLLVVSLIAVACRYLL
jgi:hypothetical protein